MGIAVSFLNSLTETAQLWILYAFYPFMQTDDLFEVACSVTNYVATEFHQASCPEIQSWQRVKDSVEYSIHFPDERSNNNPVVILLHGSSSPLSDSMLERRDFFLNNGFAVMMLNSFSKLRQLQALDKEITLQFEDIPPTYARIIKEGGLEQDYLNPISKGHAFLPAVRAADLLVALDVVRDHPGIDSSAIHLIGFSHGGSVVLEALTLVKNNKPPPGLPYLPLHPLRGVRSTVVFYPNCRVGLYYPWYITYPDIPTLMILASQDEEVNPYNCQSINVAINQKLKTDMIHEQWFNNSHAFDMKEYKNNFDHNSKLKAYDLTLKFILKH